MHEQSSSSIAFTHRRWEQIKSDAARWWAGTLERPLIQVRVHGRDPGRSEPKLPNCGFTAKYGLDTPLEAIIERWDYNLACTHFLGDAFPCVFPNFGPGVLAGYLGADVHVTDPTVWFHPREDLPIADIRFQCSLDNPWRRHIRELSAAAAEHWQGLVQIATTDLGGNLDILSTFRPGEELLLDLYDHPDEVKRLTREAHDCWWLAFDELTSAMRPPNPGFSAWTPLFSEMPYYMLQCDFCYMIGPRMFDEFVKPELEASCRKLDHAFYHLDGPGQLPHVDSLLAIPDLKGIQYVPTVEQRDGAEYPELHRKILESGKRLQVFAGYSKRFGLDLLDVIADQVGTARGIAFIADVDVSQMDEARRLLDKYGVDGGCD